MVGSLLVASITFSSTDIPLGHATSGIESYIHSEQETKSTQKNVKEDLQYENIS